MGAARTVLAGLAAWRGAATDPAARAADSPQLAFPRHATVNNEHVVLRSRHVELKPLIHFDGPKM